VGPHGEVAPPDRPSGPAGEGWTPPEKPAPATSAPPPLADQQPADKPASERATEPSWLLRAPRYLLGLVAAAIVGVAVPAAIDRGAALFGEPTAVAVLSERGLGGGGLESAYAVPQVLDDAAIDEVAAVDSADDSVAIGPHRVRVAVTNRSAHQVVVVGMRARVTQRGAPIDGTLLIRRLQGGGLPEPDIPLAIDLDAAAAVARVADPSGPAAAFFGEQSAPIDTGDSVIFAVTARTAKCTCAWGIVLSLLVDGRLEERVIEGADGPLRTTAPLDDYRAGYEQQPGQTHQWAPLADRCLTCW
jgi:hypothetical protein